MAEWKVEHVAPNVHVVHVQMAGRADTFDAFLSSDWHWDHPGCDRPLLRAHLTQAMGVNAPIFAFGDLLCAMQGPHDRRATKGKTLKEHDRPDYYTALTEDLAGWLAPYRGHLVVLGDGNHETAVTKHSGMDMLRHVVHELRANGAPHVGKGGYSGYVRFCFHRGCEQSSIRLCYHHGSGGGAPASRGTLKINRRLAAAEADIYVEGHDHNRWALPEAGQRLTDSNVIVSKPMLHIRTGGYKRAGGVSATGWETEKGMGERPLGGYLLRFWYDKSPSGTIMFGASDVMPEGRRS